VTAPETHVVKKYSNRKLYDTYTRRYVTLDVIAELLQEGHEVRVIDRNTGEDITAVTLSQILLDMERNRRGRLPEPVLVDLVKERGEQLLGIVRQSLALPRVVRQRSTQSLENRVDEVVTTGLHNLNIATLEDVDALQQRIDDLTQRVDALIAAGERSATRRRRGSQ
jgi:polyhydroxyalkanoate synthesis repressor PhaR